MPRCPTLHSYLKTQAEEGRRGILADDPSVHHLLGFERDNVKSLPVKTYIRRLWLPFESSKHSSMPRCFLDPGAERFSKEVEACVSNLVKDEDNLASEIAKDLLVVDEKTKETRSAFLEDTARTLLVTREWGDYLWGSRTFCRNPLANEKRELGDDKPPEWPRDQDLIIRTVRHWLAARLQDRLRNPKQTNKVPRIECPEEAADLVARKAVDVAQEATQSQRHEEHALRRRSTRRRKPSARAIDIGGLQSTCTDTTVTRLRSESQTGQRQCVPAGGIRISSLSHPKPSAAPSQSPDEPSGNIKLNTAEPRVASVTPSSLKRKRGVKYVKPSRTTSNARLRSTGLLPTPTPTPSIGVSHVPSGSAHGSPTGLSLAPVQNSIEQHTVHNGSNGPYELLPPTKHIVTQDYSHPNRGPQVADVTQRRTEIFVDLQDQCRQPIDIESDFVRAQNDEGSCERHCFHCRRAAPCPSSYDHHTGDDRCKRKNNSITARNLVSRVLSAATKRDISKPFVSPYDQITAHESVSEVPEPSKAVHNKRCNHDSESTVVQWKRYASDRRRDHSARAATPRADDLDIDFALLGDPKADEPHGDSF